MDTPDYIHGYHEREMQRLMDQAGTLADLLHHDTIYPKGSRILEAGCGIGAQTEWLSKNNPEISITSVDISTASIEKARQRMESMGVKNVEFQTANLYELPFSESIFDHVFVCFVLEHLNNPMAALEEMRRVLKPGGSITIIEGDHGSTFFHPFSQLAWKTIQCLIDLQAKSGGNSLIGRQLYPLVRHAGYCDVHVSPRFVYADSSRPALVEGFTRNTYIAMVEGVRDSAIEAGMIDSDTWNLGIHELTRSAESNGTFCYTFFKAVGIKP